MAVSIAGATRGARSHTGVSVVAIALAAVVAVGAAWAPRVAEASRAEAMKALEGTMVVTGTIDVGKDGSVEGHVLDQQDAMPPYVAALAARAVAAMRFEPVVEAGAPVRARAKMRMRVVARDAADGQMQVAIRSIAFGEDAVLDRDDVRKGPDRDDTASLRHLRRTPPDYPGEAARMGGKGIVYLILQVGPDGRAVQSAVEQVNLTAVGSDGEMTRIRDVLSRAALQAAKRWTFAVPTTGDMAGLPHWTIRLPIEFRMQGDRVPGYGQWSVYHPGPRALPAWAPKEAAGESPDLVPAGELALAGERPKFRLLTPIGEG